MAQMHVWAQCSLLAAPNTALQWVLELPPVWMKQAHSGATQGSPIWLNETSRKLDQQDHCLPSRYLSDMTFEPFIEIFSIGA